MGESDTLLNAVIGAVVTIVTSFLPFSPVLGGAVAGYLNGGDRSEGAKVGALSGALSLLPLVFFAFLFLLLLTGVAPAEGAVTFIFLLFVVGAFSAIYSIGLGALGGYVGIYVLEETDVGRDADRRGGGSGASGEIDDQWGSAEKDDQWGADEGDEQWGSEGRSGERTDDDERSRNDDRNNGWS